MDQFISTPSSRGALEVALRRYGHPAAVADLDSLPRDSAARKDYLESTFQMCRDSAISLVQEELAKTVNRGEELPSAEEMRARRGRGGPSADDANCPLVKALVEFGLPKELFLDYPTAMPYLRAWMGTFGRPIPEKSRMLREHVMRLEHFRKMEVRSKDKRMATSLTTSKNVIKGEKHTSEDLELSKLRPVSIRDLKMFAPNKGTYLEGKLLVDPFTPMVGCTTILEDRNGDVLLIALYNFLPDGVFGSEADPIASAKIPKGSTVRIAEPFLKVFKDGSRGVRIDNPHEITVALDDNSSMDENILLATAKASGNGLFAKNMYHAASETYIEGLRKASLVPTLLSNRSQAFMNMEDWGNALADAAASLTIRPGCKKTWARYDKTLKAMEENEEGSGENFIRTVIKKCLLPVATEGQSTHNDQSGYNALELKNEGNNAFKSGNFSRATELYSAALLATGSICRALLSNWSQCCLNMGAMNDAFAASAASIRIDRDNKAVYRLCRSLLVLGEPQLSLVAIESLVDPKTRTKKEDEITDTARNLVSLFDNDLMKQPQEVCGISQECLPYWVGDIETFDAGKKGRGVRATSDLFPGQVVLIERPIAFSEVGDNETKKATIVMNIGKSRVYDSTQHWVNQTIIGRSQREALLSSICNNLYDGASTRPLVPFESLVPNISSTRILLPSHYEFMLDMMGDPVRLSARQVEGIVSTNSHGSGSVDDLQDFQGRCTKLYPGKSMFNHSSNPTCAELPGIRGTQVSALIVLQPVKASEEVTVCYHPDEETAKRNWGL